MSSKSIFFFFYLWFPGWVAPGLGFDFSVRAGQAGALAELMVAVVLPWDQAGPGSPSRQAAWSRGMAVVQLTRLLAWLPGCLAGALLHSV